MFRKLTEKVCFIFAALPSVIQTVTFQRAAGNIHPAQRLRWKHREPVVKETWRFAHMHTRSVTHAGGNWFACVIDILSDVLCKVICHRNRRLFIWTNDSVRVLLHFLFCYCWRKQLLSSSRTFALYRFSHPTCLSGGFSETYSALCDYNGISCKEEVQWVRVVGLCHCEFFCGLHAAPCTEWRGHTVSQHDNYHF